MRSVILVLGDVMLDRTIYGAADRTSPEAPVVVLRKERSICQPGGAAAVAYFLSGLDLELDVRLAGVVGADHAAGELAKVLAQIGVNPNRLVSDSSRPTTVKERFIGQSAGRHSQQLLRVDHEMTGEPSPTVTEELWTQIATLLPDCDAVLISDYAKGVCTPELLARLIHACHWQEIPVVIDPARVSDVSRYSGADLIKPNRTWLESVLGITIEDVPAARPALAELRSRYGWWTERLLLTLDRDGMLLDEPGREPVHLPARIRQVYDVTGAGDMVQAVVGAGLARGLSGPEFAAWGVTAAGLEVERFGVVPVPWREIAAAHERPTSHDKIVSPETLRARAETARRQGRTVVFTNGCFDLLHAGHVRLLQQAAEYGEFLIVAINSDAGIRRLKGDARPYISQEQRAEMLAALGCVDAVVVFDDETPIPLLRGIRPDVLVKGAEYCQEEVVGWQVVHEYGGRIVTVPMLPDLSTTGLARKIASPSASHFSTPCCATHPL